jgi:hypothetical protein
MVQGSSGVHETPSHIFNKKGSSAHTAGWNGVKDFLELWPDVIFDYMKILVREKKEEREIKSQ